MAVAVHHYPESGGFRLQVELSEIMQHVDRHSASFDDLGHGQKARPALSVDVAADRGHRSDLLEHFENFESSNVAGVEDAVGAAQGCDGLGPQQAVCVGDYAEDKWVFTSLGIHHKPGVFRS